MQGQIERSLSRRKTWPRAWRDALWIFLLATIALAIALPRFRYGGDLSDEGFLAYGAIRVTEGQLPNRDFVSLQPPLSFYIAAAVFKILGTSIASLRLLGLAVYLLMPLASYGILRCVLTSRIIALLGATPIMILGLPLINFAPLAVWQGIATTLLAGFFFLLAISHRRASLAFAAGILTGFSLLLRHDQAIYFGISVLAFAVTAWFTENNADARRSTSRIFLLWIAGLAVLLVVPFLYWWREGALGEMFRQLIIFPITTYTRTSSLSFPRFQATQPLSQILLIALFYIPPLVYVLTAICLTMRLARHPFGRGDMINLFFLTWATTYYFQVLTRSDIYHLLTALPPFFLLAAYGWWNLTNPARGGLAFQIVSVAITGFFLWIVKPLMLPNVWEGAKLLAIERGGVRVEGGDIVSQFVQTIQQHTGPERSILVLPYQPMIYFLAERRNPTRWNYLWPGDQTRQDHERLIQQARSDPPAVVILFHESEMQDFAPAVLAYVHNEFQRAAELGDTTLYFAR